MGTTTGYELRRNYKGCSGYPYSFLFRMTSSFWAMKKNSNRCKMSAKFAGHFCLFSCLLLLSILFFVNAHTNLNGFRAFVITMRFWLCDEPGCRVTWSSGWRHWAAETERVLAGRRRPPGNRPASRTWNTTSAVRLLVYQPTTNSTGPDSRQGLYLPFHGRI